MSGGEGKWGFEGVSAQAIGWAQCGLIGKGRRTGCKNTTVTRAHVDMFGGQKCVGHNEGGRTLVNLVRTQGEGPGLPARRNESFF